MRLAIGIITANEFPAPSVFWNSLLRIQGRVYSGEVNAALPPDLRIDHFEIVNTNKFPTDVARNDVCEAIRKGGHDALLFLDADMVHPPDIVERLLLARKPVVTARYHMKKPPYSVVGYVKDPATTGPHAYRTVHYAQGLVEIERCGAGALLIQRDVLLAVHDKIGPNYFRYQRGPEPPYDFGVSEDFWFCKQARLAGFSIWLDWDLECGHVAPQIIGKDIHDAYLQRYLGDVDRMEPEARKRAAAHMVVLGFDEPITLASGEPLPQYVVAEGER